MRWSAPYRATQLDSKATQPACCSRASRWQAPRPGSGRPTCVQTKRRNIPRDHMGRRRAALLATTQTRACAAAGAAVTLGGRVVCAREAAARRPVVVSGGRRTMSATAGPTRACRDNPGGSAQQPRPRRMSFENAPHWIVGGAEQERVLFGGGGNSCRCAVHRPA